MAGAFLLRLPGDCRALSRDRMALLGGVPEAARTLESGSTVAPEAGLLGRNSSRTTSVVISWVI